MEASTMAPGAGRNQFTLGSEVMAVLDIRHLSKVFPVGGVFSRAGVHALTDVSFTIDAGQILALVGESGSGKSTTARLIARLTPPTKGELLLDGKDVFRSERRVSMDYRRRVQMIFQDPFGSLNPAHTIGHHIARPLQIHGKVRGGRELRERIHALLDQVGLNPPAEIAAKFPHQLSGGSGSGWPSPAPWPSTQRSCSRTSRSRCSTSRSGWASST